jgi:hypothetical protein
MLIQLYWIMKTNYMQIYNFVEKNKTQHKHSKCLNLLKLKHNIKLLVYEHYQVKESKNCD